MKLNKREQSMVALLLFLILWYLGVRFAIFQELFIMRSCRAERNEFVLKKKEIDKNLDRKAILEQMADVPLPGQEFESYFYEDLDAVYADRLLQGLAGLAGIELLSLEFTLSMDVNHETGEAYDKAGQEDEKIPSMVLRTASLQVRGTAADIMNMVNLLYAVENSLIVTGLDVLEQTGTGDMEGSITAVFYSLETAGSSS